MFPKNYGDWKQGVHSVMGSDTGGQDPEMYLHQQKMAFRKQEDQRRERERREQETREKRERNTKEVLEFKYKYRAKGYEGKDALVAKIVGRDRYLNDYTSDIIEAVVMKMRSQSPPEDLSVEEILNTENVYKTAVNLCSSETEKSMSKTRDTQFGLTSGNSNYSF